MSEKVLTYGQSALPSARSSFGVTKRAWSGLNLKQTIDSGGLSVAENVSTKDFPYLLTGGSMVYHFAKPDGFKSEYENPIHFSSFGDNLLVIYKKGDKILFDCISPDKQVCTGTLKSEGATEDDEVQRSVIQFNVYESPSDPVSGKYIRKMIIFPDKAVFDYDLHFVDTLPEKIDSGGTYVIGQGKVDATTGANDDGYTPGAYQFSSKKIYIGRRTKGGITSHVLLGEEGEDAFTEYSSTDKFPDAGKNYLGCICKLKDSNLFYECNAEKGEYSTTYSWDLMCGKELEVKRLEAIIETFESAVSETDPFGTTIYPPPGKTEKYNKDHYYQNISDAIPAENKNEIYRWCEVTLENGRKKWCWRVCVPPNAPPIKYAAVHQSRVFGVDDDRVYASAFNNYANWSLDTANEYNESGAWCAAVQSNVKADGKFTGIVAFDGHIIAFKNDFIHEIYGTKNPFRIQDLFSKGTIDNRTIQDVGGNLIFVSEDGVYIYSGGGLSSIGDELAVDKYEFAISGTDGRRYYLYTKNGSSGKLFLYDTRTTMWEERVCSELAGFAHCGHGMYTIQKNGIILRFDFEEAAKLHSWTAETDIMTSESLDIKHIKKIQFMLEVLHISSSAKGSQGRALSVYIDYYKTSTAKERTICLYSKEFDMVEEDDLSIIRLKPRLSSHWGFKLRFVGKGLFRLHEIEFLMESGGKRYV